MRKLNRLPLMAAFFVLFSMMAVPQLSFAATTVNYWNNGHVAIRDCATTSYGSDESGCALSNGYGDNHPIMIYVNDITSDGTYYGILGIAGSSGSGCSGTYAGACGGWYESSGLQYRLALCGWMGMPCEMTVGTPYTLTIYDGTNAYTVQVVHNSDDSFSYTSSDSIVAPFSNNPRRAVVLTAFYALRQSHDGGCDQTITVNGNNDCVSSWNFLNDQTNLGPQALSALNSAYGYPNCFASDWAVSSDACYASGYTAPSFYSDVADYGYSTAGGNHGSVGRGAQCVFFANNILYQSQSDMVTAFSFDSMASGGNNDPNLQDVVEGDVIFLYGDSTQYFTTNHVAIVVQVYRLGSEVTALDVIDSNYVSDISETPNREVIARHSFCAVGNGDCSFTGVQMIQGHYKIWTGTSYYTTSYDPNQ